MTHPSGLLDDVIHQRVRLGIMAVLAEADEAEFTFLKQQLDLTDGNLNRHLQVLEDAGYVGRRRRRSGSRSRTWIHATRTGRSALAEHLETLQRLIDQTKGTT
jgi:DNA-binding MarR family transcriptional regulator